MSYVEEREFTLRFELRCEFPENYEGEADGFEWVKDFPAIAQPLARLNPAARKAAWQLLGPEEASA